MDDSGEETSPGRPNAQVGRRSTWDQAGTSALSAEAGAKLAAYADLVRRWSARVDLVSPGDLERFEARHVLDSLRLLPLVTDLPAGPAVDVGSGAGLPGIPLAIAQPERTWRLLEPRAKRAGFLEEAVRTLELDCEVVTAPAERAALSLGGSHVLATGRALAVPERAFELLLPLVRPGGVAALFVGPDASLPSEATLWRQGIAIVERRSPSERK